MDPLLIGFLAIVTFLLATEEHATHWLQLQLSLLGVHLRGRLLQARLSLRLRLDRYSFTADTVLARLIRWWGLRLILNNKAYAELFAMTDKYDQTTTDDTP